jgi:predicted GNAT family acetyltransferase/uncharacterized Fe-S cluster protein YjdI
MTENYELIDNEEKHQYEFHVEGYVPRIEYIKSLNGEIYLTHTEVPAALGGHGIGSQLAEKVLTDIERQGLRLVPLCPFVAGYIHKHPEWKRIVLRGIHIQYIKTVMGKQIEYSNGELTIVWQPELCRHAGICVKTLPNVYHPKERPWIKMENATTEELIAQIKMCPSGALSYKLKK